MALANLQEGNTHNQDDERGEDGEDSLPKS